MSEPTPFQVDLVTGATGLVGAELVTQLLERGHQVVALVRDVPAHSRWITDGLQLRVDEVRGDVRDYELLLRTVREYAVTAIYHLAAQPIVSLAEEDPRETLDINILGTVNVLEVARLTHAVVVMASSDKAYGDQGEHITLEEAPLRGVRPYEVSKVCADLIAQSYFQSYGLPVAIVRSGNIFGPGDLHFSRLVPSAIMAALAGRRPVLRSDGTPVRDYVYVADAAAAYVLLGKLLNLGGAGGPAAVRGQAFNVSGRATAARFMAQLAAAAAGRPDLEPLVLGELQARTEIQHQVLAAGRLLNLGWTPQHTDVPAALALTAQWYREVFPVAPPARISLDSEPSGHRVSPSHHEATP